ncbi:MAG: Y-family DNA polymerase, partial [Pyrinomonadaceae bacterium]
MLWACLHFPLLPLQITSQGDERPFAISESDVVFICNESARDSGIKPGMKLAAAFALDSRLKIFSRDEQKEIAALRGIALWAGQFTPTVSLAPPSAVLLEIGGCFSLFGGLNRLLQKMQAGSRELGYGVVMSSAATPSAALLLARAGLELHDVQQLEKQIGPLPVTLLDVTPDILQSLEAIGMRTISDVLALPRDGLARRFGQELLDTLGKVLGHLPDPRSPFVPPAGYANKLELMTPVHDAEALLFGAKRLIGELTGFLSAKNAGVLKINLDLYHEDESVTRVPFTLSLATRDAAHLTSILRERLFNLTLPQRVEAIALEACEVTPLRSRNFSLFGDHEQEQENRAALTERLQTRLGMGAVLKLSTFPDHRPEFAWRFDESKRGGRRQAEDRRRNPFHPSSFIP